MRRTERTLYVNNVSEAAIQALFDALGIDHTWISLFQGTPREEWPAMADSLRAFLPSKGVQYDVCGALDVKDATAMAFTLNPKVGEVILYFSKRTTLETLLETKAAKHGKVTFPDPWKDASVTPGMYFFRLNNKGKLTFAEAEMSPIFGYAAMLCTKQLNAGATEFMSQVRMKEATVSHGKTSGVLRMENGKITLA